MPLYSFLGICVFPREIFCAVGKLRFSKNRFASFSNSGNFENTFFVAFESIFLPILSKDYHAVNQILPVYRYRSCCLRLCADGQGWCLSREQYVTGTK